MRMRLMVSFGNSIGGAALGGLYQGNHLLGASIGAVLGFFIGWVATS